MNETLYYLAAIIDGEGCVSFDIANRLREITISNTEESIIRKVSEYLDLFGIDHSIRVDPTNGGGNRKPIYIVSIGGQENLEFIYENVPLASEAKRYKLSQIVSSYKLATPAPRKKRAARPVGW